jgi:hypothetical protein
MRELKIQATMTGRLAAWCSMPRQLPGSLSIVHCPLSIPTLRAEVAPFDPAARLS